AGVHPVVVRGGLALARRLVPIDYSGRSAVCKCPSIAAACSASYLARREVMPSSRSKNSSIICTIVAERLGGTGCRARHLSIRWMKAGSTRRSRAAVLRAITAPPVIPAPLVAGRDIAGIGAQNFLAAFQPLPAVGVLAKAVCLPDKSGLPWVPRNANGLNVSVDFVSFAVGRAADEAECLFHSSSPSAGCSPAGFLAAAGRGGSRSPGGTPAGGSVAAAAIRRRSLIAS